MPNWIKRFRTSEDGAVTVDWVVLTAAVVGLTIGLITLIANGATDPAEGLGARMSSQTIMTFN